MHEKTIIQYGDVLTEGVQKTKGRKKTKTGKSIKLHVKRRVCWLEGIQWKFRGHGDQCECITL